MTGFPEPDAIAVIAGEQKNPFTLFVRPRDLEMETWYGRREGTEGAEKKYQADKALPIEKFEQELPKLLNGHEKLYYRFGVDNRLDQTILQYLSAQRFRRLKTAYPPHTIIDPTLLIHEMRLIKPKRAELMQKSAILRSKRTLAISGKPGMKRNHIERL